MIISSNRSPSLPEFQSLINNATVKLNEDANKRASYYEKRNAQLLEDDVKSVLDVVAQGTSFENTIEKISGQRFPDIVAAKYYGVEVKSSKDEKWLSLGGSVNESTRVEDVQRIFLTFGKLVKPIEFRSRPYEDCLSEVVVTHYPRYKIDMNLHKGNTIFDKMNTTYDELRQDRNAVRSIVKYYKSQLKQGESLWWIDSEEEIEESATSMKVRLWSSLSKEEKAMLTTSLFVHFPDMLSTTNNKKYGKAVLWLASHHGIVDSSFRDKFSAGGKVSVITRKGSFINIPQVFGHMQEFAADIRLQLNSINESVLRETWEVSTIENDRVSQWINLVADKHQATDYSSIEVLTAIFDSK